MNRIFRASCKTELIGASCALLIGASCASFKVDSSRKLMPYHLRLLLRLNDDLASLMLPPTRL